VFFRKISISIPQYVYDEIIDHAKGEYPNECCGVLVGTIFNKDKKVFSSHRATNVNPDRTKDRYLIDPKEINFIDRQARTETLDIIGFYHSHPDHPDRPSEYDRELGQPGYSYVIVSVKGGSDISAKSWAFEDDGEAFKEEKIKVG
jgi:proteasome lid subunit RPN8/RPN11